MKTQTRKKNLEKRQKAFDEYIAPKFGSMINPGSFRRPGSLKK